MIFTAILSNPDHPEYGVVSVPFPIPNNQYDEITEMLCQLEIGDPIMQDCKLEEISGETSVLKHMEKTRVNVDELDYLSKRLDGFDQYEKTQFEGIAYRLGVCSVDELINLTFSCQEVTVVTDFNDFEALGRRHYLTMNGGASAEEMQKNNFCKLALDLLEGDVGRVTPYGVVFDNNFNYDEYYDGLHFPEYRYEDCVMEIEMVSRFADEDAPVSYLYLPMPQTQIEHTMLRAGIDSYGDMRLRFLESELPTEIDAALDMEHEELGALNEMCAAIAKLDSGNREKLGAAVTLAQPEYASQIRQLAENIELFEFVPKVHTAEELGKYMIMESGHYEFDENLAGYIDFEKYGADRVERDGGAFTDRGYVSYHGTLSLDELMMEEPAEQSFQMDMK
jgi:Antirestriction protein (ArdA).